jgi:hypothetical protein
MNAEQFNASGSASGSSNSGGIMAWVVFNGTGTPSIIASSSNISSITDNGVGDYTINFSPAVQDANYAMSGSGSGDSYKDLICFKAASEGAAATTKTASACRIVCGRSEGTTTDGNVISVTFVR